jgi:phosphoribosyl 1,2-cyclic phosphodiesterase
MLLKVLGSSSSGNSYLLKSSSGEVLMLEAGIKISEIKKALDFDISKIAGCILSHSHGDHARYAQEITKSGIDLYTSEGTLSEIGLSGHRAKSLHKNVVYFLGDFQILPFKVKHDCKDPMGFLIRHDEMGTTLFLTDSYYSEFKFSGLNHILVECNYSDDILEGNVFNGTIPAAHANRVRESHMSLQTNKELFKANDLSKVNNIILIHLSNDNSDAKRFQREITELTGKNVLIADKGLNIELSKNPF